MKKKEFISLLQTYLDGEATEAQEQMLLNYYNSFQQEDNIDKPDNKEEETTLDVIFSRIQQEIHIEKNPKKRPASKIVGIRWWLAAAAVILLGFSFYFFSIYSPEKNPIAAEDQPKAEDILPGKNGAVLTLADGRQILLDDLANGTTIANQFGAMITLENGGLVYNDSNDINGTNIAYNILTTPKGRQFQLVLPDGSHVWLNAASSIKFPVAFASNERRVTISGEAYFEVTKLKQKDRNEDLDAVPFIVDIDSKASVKVLGTSFNINAYENEEYIHTTLVEGSVRFEKKGDGVFLKPGEQGTLNQSGFSVNKSADIEKALAWKNGLFNFQNAGVAEVMNQLERWFDIEVVYAKGIPDIKFWGEMSRNVSLDGVLKGLKDAKLHFRLERGRKLVILQ